MRPRTQDLLSIRDGEPVDAAVRATVEHDPRLGAELERLEETRAALQALPQLTPPAGVWERVLEQSAVRYATRRSRRWRWPLRGAIAAGVAVLAVSIVARFPGSAEQDEIPPSTIVADQPVDSPIASAWVRPAYASLVEESARLERALDDIPYQPSVVRAGTATTIADLEASIALADERLWYASAMNASPAQKHALVRQRTELMNALYQVRRAEARRFGY